MKFGNSKPKRVIKIKRKIHASQKHDALASVIKRLENEKQGFNAKKEVESSIGDKESEFFDKIDYQSFIVCFIAYGLFNCIYWIYMLLY